MPIRANRDRDSAPPQDVRQTTSAGAFLPTNAFREGAGLPRADFVAPERRLRRNGNARIEPGLSTVPWTVHRTHCAPVGRKSIERSLEEFIAAVQRYDDNSTAKPSMRSMTVVVPSEIEELPLQILGRPEEGAVQTFAPNGANQPFNKRMRQRHVRHGSWCLTRTDSATIETHATGASQSGNRR